MTESFEKIKDEIINKFSFIGLNDEEIKEALEKLIKLQGEALEGNIQKLVLRRYYYYFLTYVYPQIRVMLNVNNNNSSLLQSLFDYKKDINQKNLKYIEQALNDYGFYFQKPLNDFKDLENNPLINVVTGKEVTMDDNLEYFAKKDLFMMEHSYNKEFMTKHPSIEYNYNVNYWENYAENIKKRFDYLNEYLYKQIPSFNDNENDYLEYLEDYKKYIKAYEKYKGSEIDEQNKKH